MTTRWQAFRRHQQRRYNPLQQGLQLTGLVLLVCFYAYAFFNWQPTDRNHDTIVAWNEALKAKARIVATDRAAKRIQQRTNPTERLETGGNNTTLAEQMHSISKNQAVSQPTSVDRLVDILLLFYVVGMALRCYIRVARPQSQREFRRQSRVQQERRRQRFRAWVERLNQQRQANGARPISQSSLELVLRERDMTAEDYDQLLQFEEEGGIQTLLSGMGASQSEIDRCPMRTVAAEDDELLVGSDPPPQCPICLEPYQLHQQVRTIPCFHTFHKACVDPWLSQKAVCPVCKHSAIG